MTNLTVSKWSANKSLKSTSLPLGDLVQALGVNDSWRKNGN
ncbi:MAG: hypothetical protein ACI9LO_002138 [Planctomycetota bacterium]|jgi:hypothetical protein